MLAEQRAPAPLVDLHLLAGKRRPGIPIPEQAAAVHGVTTDHAHTHGRPAEQVR